MSAHSAQLQRSTARAGDPARGPGGARGLLDDALVRWWLVSVALAVASAILLPTVPSYDPFSWIVWGREVTDPHLSFFVGDGPSWKPLPFAFTTVYSLFGSLSPTLWVITARAGGIAGLIGMWRLAALCCRRGGLPAWSGWVAGAAACAGIILTAPDSGVAYYFFRGTSEPLVIGVWVWAIERFIQRHHWQAYMLVALEGLMRPESWIFLVIYGAWLLWRIPGMRIWVLVGLAAQPFGWFVPPWISTGHAFLAANHAHDYNGQLGADPLKTVLLRGEDIQPLPSLVFALVAMVFGLWDARRWPRSPRALAARIASEQSETGLVLGLAAATILWWVAVVAETMDGYPGLMRFYLPAAATMCILSGYGLARTATLAGTLSARLLRSARGMRHPSPGGGRLSAGTGLAVIAAVVALSVHFVSARWAYARAQEPIAHTAVGRIAQLGEAVRLLGGKAAILPCKSSEVTINHSLQTALAWKLGTTLERVETVLTVPGIAFVGPHDSIDGIAPPIAFKFRAVLIRRVGAWQIFRVYRAGPHPGARCVGR
jgi:hypothetical protein